ncbi:MAG: MBL fold metallo-hydrolase [Lachnospirales bacterium]
MKLKFATIASSSSGNCVYIGTEYTNILIDAGLSGKKIEEALKDLELTGQDIDAVFVTHEHIDHVDGVGVLARRYNIPIYATEGTWANMPSKVKAETIRDDFKRNVYADENMVFNDLLIRPFDIPHDAAQPVGYSVMTDNDKITVATDIGHISDTIKENVKGSSILLLESNHDLDMLKNGSYAYNLKQRILSDYGHLSNDNAGKFLSDYADSRLKYVFLGHLSKENNTPRVAFDTVKDIVTDSGVELGGDFDMWVAAPYGVKRRIEL